MDIGSLYNMAKGLCNWKAFIHLVRYGLYASLLIYVLLFLRSTELKVEKHALKSATFWVSTRIDAQLRASGGARGSHCDKATNDSNYIYYRCVQIENPDSFFGIAVIYPSQDAVGIGLSDVFVNQSRFSAPVSEEMLFGLFAYSLLVDVEEYFGKATMKFTNTVMMATDQNTHLAISLRHKLIISEEAQWDVKEIVYLGVLLTVGTLELILACRRNFAKTAEGKEEYQVVNGEATNMV